MTPIDFVFVAAGSASRRIRVARLSRTDEQSLLPMSGTSGQTLTPFQAATTPAREGDRAWFFKSFGLPPSDFGSVFVCTRMRGKILLALHRRGAPASAVHLSDRVREDNARCVVRRFDISARLAGSREMRLFCRHCPPFAVIVNDASDFCTTTGSVPNASRCRLSGSREGTTSASMRAPAALSNARFCLHVGPGSPAAASIERKTCGRAALAQVDIRRPRGRPRSRRASLFVHV